MNQSDGVVVCAVTTKSLGAALEMVGTAARYWACCSALTLATSSQEPGGKAEVISAEGDRGAIAKIRPPTSRTSKPAGSRALSRLLSSPLGCALGCAMAGLEGAVPGTCLQTPYDVTGGA